MILYSPWQHIVCLQCWPQYAIENPTNPIKWSSKSNDLQCCHCGSLLATGAAFWKNPVTMRCGGSAFAHALPSMESKPEREDKKRRIII